MSKMYYVSYETAKEKLNLASENENSDRISLAYCNQFVKDALEEAGANDAEKDKYLETIVLKVFEKMQDNQTEQREVEMVGMYEAVKDALVWV